VDPVTAGAAPVPSRSLVGPKAIVYVGRGGWGVCSGDTGDANGRRRRSRRCGGHGYDLRGMPREVGQPGDRWLASDGGVGSVVILEMEPAEHCGVALFG